MRNYIQVKKLWIDMFTKYGPLLFRFPIEKIKIDKSLFDYQNDVSNSAVFYMLVNFDRELWMPITLNKDYYLLDGQHRLELARQMGLSYIDAVIEDSELLGGNNKKQTVKTKNILKKQRDMK